MSRPGRVLVTGATGFIGTHVCERLALETGFPVRALVHAWPHAVRVAHLPVELVAGDLAVAGSVRQAVEGCDAVVHLATGGRQGFVAGTRNLVAAARAAGVRRFVHMSTTAVYGLTPPPTLASEETPLRRVGESYCDWKIAAERAVWAGVRRGLPAVVLRPSIVYGPHSRWNTGTLEKIAAGAYWLVDEGRGTCNTVFVDNLVDAVLAALARPEAPGQAFFITDDKPVTWAEFATAHAALLDPPPDLPAIAAETVFVHHRRQGGLLRQSVGPLGRLLLSPELRQQLQTVPVFNHLLALAAGRLTPGRKAVIKRLAGRRRQPAGGGPAMPDLVTAMVQSCRVTFSSDKARRLLGWEPRVSFREGMALTAEWLRWAGYLRPGAPGR